MIDRQCIDEYLSYMKLSKLDMSKLEPVDIIETNKRRFSDIQNETMDSIVNSGGIDNFGEFSDDELNQTIRDLRREESYTNPRDGKKFISIQRIEAEENMRRREVTADK